jgi:hypothetical protein
MSHHQLVRVAVTLSGAIASVLVAVAQGSRSTQSEVARTAVDSYLRKPLTETTSLPPYAHALLDGVDDWPSAETTLGWSATMPFEPAMDADTVPTESRRISFAVTPEFHHQIYERSQEEHRAVASLVRRAIEWYLFEQIVSTAGLRGSKEAHH